jgi:hypothetical protein
MNSLDQKQDVPPYQGFYLLKNHVEIQVNQQRALLLCQICGGCRYQSNTVTKLGILNGREIQRPNKFKATSSAVQGKSCIKFAAIES